MVATQWLFLTGILVGVPIGIALTIALIERR